MALIDRTRVVLFQDVGELVPVDCTNGSMEDGAVRLLAFPDSHSVRPTVKSH